MVYTLSEDRKVILGMFDDLKILLEKHVEEDDVTVTQLVVAAQNKLIWLEVIDIEDEGEPRHEVKVRLTLALPGFPKDFCFVGKQCKYSNYDLMVSI